MRGTACSTHCDNGMVPTLEVSSRKFTSMTSSVFETIVCFLSFASSVSTRDLTLGLTSAPSLSCTFASDAEKYRKCQHAHESREWSEKLKASGAFVCYYPTGPPPDTHPAWTQTQNGTDLACVLSRAGLGESAVPCYKILQETSDIRESARFEFLQTYLLGESSKHCLCCFSGYLTHPLLHGNCFKFLKVYFSNGGGGGHGEVRGQLAKVNSLFLPCGS